MKAIWNPTRSGMITRSDFLSTLAVLKSEEKLSIAVPSKKVKNPIKVYEIPAAFDTETTSFLTADGEPRAIMYHWQFGVGDMVTFGRTWEEFVTFMFALHAILGTSNNLRLRVYVHNLGFDFQFMRKWLKWDKVFFLNKLTPLYALTDTGIEFRCSWKLSNTSLETIGKNLNKYIVHKMSGDLDYSVARTPLTPLTEEELKYCENDIRVLLAYILEKIETEGILNIPLTSTGYVRGKCKEECNKNYKQYHKVISTLTLGYHEYDMLKQCFQGGFTHGNYLMRNKTWENVASYDITSSYPAVMLAKKFPMSKGQKTEDIKTIEDVFKYSEKYCIMLTIKFDLIMSKYRYERILSKSKCDKKLLSADRISDNGRIDSAKNVRITITETDLYWLTKYYEYTNYEIEECWIYIKSYLPVSFIRTVMSFYRDKQKLKHNKSKKVEYALSKNMLNATYGMAVTDIVRASLEYKDDMIISEPADIVEQINKYNKKKDRFLFYPWGIWVTSYARARLFKVIYELGEDYLYSDTDSVKILNYESHKDFFEKENNEFKSEVIVAAEHFHLTEDDYNPNGLFIGIWDFEEMYKRFKYLNAKRYIYETSDGEIFTTIAGASKTKVPDYLSKTFDNPFDAFNENLVIPEEYSGRTIATHIDDETTGVLVDYLGVEYKYYERSSIAIMPTSYSMSMSSEFERFLKMQYALYDGEI